MRFKLIMITFFSLLLIITSSAFARSFEAMVDFKGAQYVKVGTNPELAVFIEDCTPTRAIQVKIPLRPDTGPVRPHVTPLFLTEKYVGPDECKGVHISGYRDSMGMILDCTFAQTGSKDSKILPGRWLIRCEPGDRNQHSPPSS